MWVLCCLQNFLPFFHYFFTPLSLTLCVWWMQPRPEQEASFPCLQIPVGLREFGSPTWDRNKFGKGKLPMAVTHNAEEPWHSRKREGSFGTAQPSNPDREELELYSCLPGWSFRTQNKFNVGEVGTRLGRAPLNFSVIPEARCLHSADFKEEIRNFQLKLWFRCSQLYKCSTLCIKYLPFHKFPLFPRISCSLVTTESLLK